MVTFVVVLVTTVAGTALATRQLLLSRLDDRISSELEQEVEELRVFADRGLDPATGEPFGADAARLLTVFLERSIPSPGETMVTFVDGAPHRRPPHEVPYRVDRDPDLVSRWATVTTTETGVVDTPAGPFQCLAVPVVGQAEDPAVFVVGIFRERALQEITETTQVAALAGLVAVVLGALAATGVASRILRPLRRMTSTAADLGEADLGRRLEVDGHDEVAGLAATFNAMLDRLEDAFATQRRFVDDAGHELRTPITVIRGHLELLEHETDPAERNATVALVLDELDRMHRIVEDLLLLAKSDQPDFVRPGRFDLDELTRSAVRKASALSPQHTFELDTTGVGVVRGDQQRLTQALMQLADNAAKHTPPGTSVAIGSALDGEQYRLWVEDDGPGVAAADRPHVFDRFRRGVDQPRRSEGAGLGLAIVKAIAEAHGGRVDLLPGTAGGARFELSIPSEVD